MQVFFKLGYVYVMNLVYYFVYAEYLLLTKIKILITLSMKISY
jgi:hypothetical protein